MAAEFGFGELKMPSSRAVYDDEDEENEPPGNLEEILSSPLFHWLPLLVKNTASPTENLQCSLLVFGIGEVATSFLQAHFLSTGNEAIAQITENEDLAQEENLKKCFLFHRLNTNHDTVFCQTNMNLAPEKSFSWTCKVFEQISPSKVLLITSYSACEYHSVSPDKLQSDFVKVLKTDSWSTKGYSVDCDFLETPNMIKGMPAAVLSHCQVHNIPAAVYVCYTESSHLDSRSIEALEFLLKSSHLKILKRNTEGEVRKYLKSIMAGKLTESNIYI